MRYGFTVMAEQSTPRQMIDGAVRAEQAGFDFLMVSDHFHPWLEEQGQSPFTWSILGAIAERTERIEIITAVTCPFLRYHPAVIAQAAATIAILSDGRFTLGVGAGENLNEHVVGLGWPAVDVRHAMLSESLEIIRELWTGGVHTFRGAHMEVENARLFTLPATPPEIVVAAGGPQAAQLAAEIGDGLMAVEANPELVQGYAGAGGAGKPVYGQFAVCYATDAAAARRTALERWRFATPGWRVMAELPDPKSFAAAAETVREEDIAEMVTCGCDPDAFVEAFATWEKAGFTHVGVVQAGDDQEGFLAFWERELRDRLRGAAATAATAETRSS